MNIINTEFIARLLQHYSSLVITGNEKSGRSLIAIDILKEKIKINNNLKFTIFTSTSDSVYRKHFPQTSIFKGDALDELNKIQKKYMHYNIDKSINTSYLLILDDCGKKMFEQINIIVNTCSNYNIYVILIPSPIHMECIDWEKYKFDYIIKADKENSILEINKKCIDLIMEDIFFEYSDSDSDNNNNTNKSDNKLPNIENISFKHNDSDIEIDKKPDFTINQLHKNETIPKEETLIKYKYSVRPELLKKNIDITTMIDKFFLSM